MTTPTLAPGARVVIRDEEWIVRRSNKATPGGIAVQVTGSSELVRGKEAIFLTDLDKVTELAPEDTALVTDDSPQYRRTRLFLEALLRRTPPPAGDDRIYLGHRGAIRNAPYQLYPAAKALRQPQPRLLIADGVGLGKTIEAGILLTELIERGRGQRILVVALKSILAQFQKELWARFTIPLVRLDSVGIQRVQSKIPSSMNPFHYFDRVIVSIDTLKKDAKYRRYLEQCHWDAIVVDECQNVADRSGTQQGSRATSQRANLARLLARTTDALILTSATPHDGKAESFASVIQLLDPSAVADRSNYTHDDVKDLYVRRFKKDIAHEVGDAFQERIVVPQHVEASPSENAVFACLQNLEFRTIAVQRNSKGILFRTLLLKSFLSSPAACASTIDERLKTLDKLDAADKVDPEALTHDRNALRALGTLVAKVTAADFAKYECLLQQLRQLDFGKKNHETRLVLFSERIDTLEFLQQQLTVDLGLREGQTALFYGSLDDQAQTSIVQAFGTKDSRLRLLLASDAAAEGLNLHYFCHQLVHFDLPWSLITLEQRNGRVDRYGQQHQPVLTYLLTRPADKKLRGDLRILDLLIEKEQMAHKNLGDVAWLLKLHDAEREEEHIAKGIESGEAPETILPDTESPDDLLSILLGTDTEAVEAAKTTSDPTLYSDDVAFCRDALATLATTRTDLVVQHHDHLQGFTLHPPEDLQHRLSYLPPELLQQKEGKHSVLKLTADRQRVMDSLEEARQKEESWPEWQLLWEQHPVCEWLDDTLVAAFDRHEAPVIQLKKGIGREETVFLLQGQLTNERGQPVIVEWFGVSCKGDAATSIRPLGPLLIETGLDQPQANPGRPLAEAAERHLRSLLRTAVERGRLHMDGVRKERAASLSAPLSENLRRLGAWETRRIEQIQGQRLAYSSQGKAIPAPTRKRLEQEEHEVQAFKKKRHEWLQEGVRTNPIPYLRVVAVLVSV
jgi:superfamily II DNA or RNA helicase